VSGPIPVYEAVEWIEPAPGGGSSAQGRAVPTLAQVEATYGNGFAVGPSRGINAPPKIIERGFGHVDDEGPDRAIFYRLADGRRCGDNGRVGVGACVCLRVARRSEHELQTDNKRG
jgi:hypothetical protein